MSKSKTFGYVRVSTRDQNIDRQLVAMHDIGIDERDIFIEKASGKNFIRPQYQALKAQLREGDILYITSLDRLGRNSNEIESEWDELTQKIGIDIVKIINSFKILFLVDFIFNSLIQYTFHSIEVLKFLFLIAVQTSINVLKQLNMDIEI